MSYDRTFVDGRRRLGRLHGAGALGARHRGAPARDEGHQLLARQMFERGLPARDGARPARHRADDAGPGELPDRARRGGARRRAAAHAGAPPRATGTATHATAGLALVRADADLRQRPAAAGAVPGARRSAPRREPADRHARRSSSSRRPASRTTGWCWSATPAGIPRRRHGPTPTSSRPTPPRSCSRFAAPTGSPAITATSAGCASRSPGSSGPTAWASPSTTSATAGCRDGLGAGGPNLNEGAESTICFPALAHRDAGARRRRPRVRRRRAR